VVVVEPEGFGDILERCLLLCDLEGNWLLIGLAILVQVNLSQEAGTILERFYNLL